MRPLTLQAPVFIFSKDTFITWYFDYKYCKRLLALCPLLLILARDTSLCLLLFTLVEDLLFPLVCKRQISLCPLLFSPCFVILFCKRIYKSFPSYQIPQEMCFTAHPLLFVLVKDFSSTILSYFL